jgi:hypothetical protein
MSTEIVGRAMSVDRILTILSVIVASFATIASTVQAYVSWQGRNDILRSIVLTELNSKCADLNRDTHVFRLDPSSSQYEIVFLMLSKLRRL